MTHKVKRWTASMLVLLLLLSTAACGFGKHPTQTTEPGTDPTAAPTAQPTTEPTSGPTTAPTASPTVPSVPDVQENIQMEQVRMSGYDENWISRFRYLLGQSLCVGTEQELSDALDRIRTLDKEFSLGQTYDAEFFRQYFLVLIPASSTSGSVRFEAEAALENGTVTISVTGQLSGAGTADMADWLLLAALPRADYSPEMTIEVRTAGATAPGLDLDVNDR